MPRQAVVDEIVGVKGKRMRYCAAALAAHLGSLVKTEDMMLSGHTYFASLFSLAAYKLTGAIDMPSKVAPRLWFEAVGSGTNSRHLARHAVHQGLNGVRS